MSQNAARPTLPGSFFGHLPPASAQDLLRRATRRSLSAGEYLFREGEPASAFHVLVAGTVDVLRAQGDAAEVPVGALRQGAVSGLLGLFTGRTRSTSARARGPAVLLEVSSADLSELAQQDDALHDRLVAYYRARLVEKFVGGSWLFDPLPPAARQQLSDLFVARPLEPGEVLMRPGEVANLLAVVVQGKLLLQSVRQPGQRPRTYELSAGQYLAVTSALTGVPGRMKLYAAEPALLALADHQALAPFIQEQPALRWLPKRLPEIARALDRDVHCGHARLGEP